MANEYAYTKDKAIRKLGAGALGALGRKKNKNTNREIGAEENRTKKITQKEKETLEEKLKKEQSSMSRSNFFSNADKGFRKDKSDYEKVDKGFKKRKSDDEKIQDSSFDSGMGKSEKVFDEIKTSKKEAGRVIKAKGGRVNFSKGGGCALRGLKKNAYGKNS